MNKVDKFFDEIFSIFGFGVKKKSSRSFAFIIWLINVIFSLTIIIVHAYDGKSVFISYDALSKITDIVQLFGPICVHLVVISLNLFHFEIYQLILEKKESLDELLKLFKNNENNIFFERVQNKRNFSFLMKALAIIIVGNGIEIFLMKT